MKKAEVESCKYCQSKYPLFYEDGDDGALRSSDIVCVNIKNNAIKLSLELYEVGIVRTIPIEFCPVCGRKLERTK